MQYSTNFNMNKPELNEQYRLEHWNKNTDIIDSAIQTEIDTRTSQVNTLTQNLSNGIIEAKNLANATGILAVAKGGTGKSTVQEALENLCSNIATPASVLPTDDFIFKREGGVKKMDLDTIATKIYDLIHARIETVIPVGIIYPFAGEFGNNYENVPHGYLACDGQAVSRTEYATLFSIIGTKYGSGDEINTFNVPDLRECTMVGAGQSTRTGIETHDVYTIGQFKDDQLQGHWHTKGIWQATEGWNDGFGYIKTTSNKYGSPNNVYSSDGTNGTPRIGTTTHGKQVGVNYIIKY